jgi:putative ABC transport system permease protein
MIYNYLKIAWRNLFKNKMFSFINIFGLAVSMSVCLLIILIITEQKNYDQWHDKKNRIYRIHTVGKNGNASEMASSAMPLSEKLQTNYAEIEKAATLVRNIGGDIIYKNKIASGGGYFADEKIFEIFDFKFAKGNIKTALNDPYSLVIDEDLAKQLFENEYPIGKIVKFNDKKISPTGHENGNKEKEYGTFTITGVLKKNIGKTHLPFKLLASIKTISALTKSKILNYEADDWSNVWENYTYVLLNARKQKSDLQKILNNVSEDIYDKKEVSNRFSFIAIPLTDISTCNIVGNPTSITIPRSILFILGVLCLIVMLSSCLNYTNLSVARALTRAKEVGVRKVVGAKRKQIFSQFMAEAVLFSFLALFVAIGLLQILKIGFANLWFNQFLNITFEPQQNVYLIFTAFALVVGIAAGFLPSIYISKLNPVQIIKNINGVKLFRHLTFRRALLVLQFTISLVFIISTALVLTQTKHLLNFDYGFNKENVVNVPVYNTKNYERFVSEIQTNKSILAVSACNNLPASGNSSGTSAFTQDRKINAAVYFLDIDGKCLNVWNLKLLAGKNLPEIPSDSSEQCVLINEKMVNDFKFGSNIAAIGQKLLLDGNDVEIVGVVKNFQFLDVTQKMEALVLRNRKAEFGYATIKLSGINTPEALAFLEKSWKKVNPNTKFEYKFFDEQTMMIHNLLNNAANILSVLSFLAVFISCLGLLGIVIYSAETRTKEIGIRKVLGSSVFEIVTLLSKGFTTLILLAIVIGTPLAYFINTIWLNYFSSRVSISLEIIFLCVFILTAICLLVVLSQSWLAARLNPVKSLKTE